MPHDAPSRRTILWLTPAQTPLLKRLADAAHLDVAAVGSPDATLSSAAAKEWGDAESLSDLRAAIATAPRGTLVLIADPGAFGSPSSRGGGTDTDATRLDVEELDNAHERGVKVACLEPLPAALTQLAAAGVKVAAQSTTPVNTGGDWAMLAPLSRYRRSIRELRETLPTLGAVRALSIHALGAPAHGSLGARLFDAADLALTLLGQPETVHAVYTSPSATRGAHAAPPPPDHLRALDGDLTATLRYAGNKSATITASNRAARPGLAVTLLATAGTASIADDRLVIDHTESHAHDQSGAPSEPEAAFVSALATQLTRYLDSGVGLAGEVDFAATLALAQAALLSARTGEPESPATMLRLVGF